MRKTAVSFNLMGKLMVFLERGAMKSEILYDYMKKAEQLVLNSNPEGMLELVEKEKEKCQEEPNLSAFFQGEHAFYSKKYRQALEKYLEAKEIPHYQFFCYRASAYLSKELEEKPKALTYAHKANSLHPEDYLTLKILNTLYSEEDGSREASEVREKMAQLEKGHKPSHEICPQTGPSLTEEEYQELLSISQESSHEGLFVNDLKEERCRKKELEQDQSFIEELPMGLKDSNNMNSILEKPAFLSSLGIEIKLDAFVNKYRELLEDYAQNAEKRKEIPDRKLYLFNAWSKDSKDLPMPSHMSNLEDSKSGFFIRWNGRGIAVNPGHTFLELLRERKLTILDIDTVILTHSKRDLYSATTKLYELNGQLNRVLGRQHPIHFYFNRSAYQEMIQILKPQYRQEKSTLHCLELYLDTPDIETLTLHEGLNLCYFQTGQNNPTYEGINLGIKLVMQSDDKKRTLGYLSGGAWTPHLSQHLAGSDLLILGFGTTTHDDLTKQRYQEDCLGYFGTLSLFEEISPQICILSEFDQKIAGARLEICKHLRNELFEQLFDSSLLLSDTQLEVDLYELNIRCTATSSWTNPAYAKIVQSLDPFAPLQFLSQLSYI